MSTRRAFMQASFATVGLAGLGGVAQTTQVVSAHFMQRVIYDTRFADSVAFGAEAARLGHAIVPMHGDITQLWRDDLSLLWQESPAPIAGMTAPDALFCIEQLARDAGLRMALRIEHRRDAAGQLAHAVGDGNGSFDRNVAADQWVREAARSIASCSRGAPPLGATCLAPRQAGEQQPLVTWAFVSKTMMEDKA